MDFRTREHNPVLTLVVAALFYVLSVVGQLTGTIAFKPGAETLTMVIHSVPALAILWAVIRLGGHPAIAILAALVGPVLMALVLFR